MRTYDLSALPPGIHALRVKAIGDGWLNHDSIYSVPLSYLVYPEDYIDLKTFIRHMASSPLGD
ncbi:MAG: hypothetical protein EA374_05555 [Acholeplasmatales bacterium]|nr:MAG: hypothetical protein EA374_05555 [Acholeplasmatales bacterium]